MLEDVVSKQPPALWFIVIATVVPHVAVSIIIPVRAAPGFARTDTLILELFDPDVGVTLSHDKDSETVQVEFEVILIV